VKNWTKFSRPIKVRTVIIRKVPGETKKPKHQEKDSAKEKGRNHHRGTKCRGTENPRKGFSPAELGGCLPRATHSCRIPSQSKLTMKGDEASTKKEKKVFWAVGEGSNPETGSEKKGFYTRPLRS